MYVQSWNATVSAIDTNTLRQPRLKLTCTVSCPICELREVVTSSTIIESDHLKRTKQLGQDRLERTLRACVVEELATGHTCAGCGVSSIIPKAQAQRLTAAVLAGVSHQWLSEALKALGCNVDDQRCTPMLRVAVDHLKTVIKLSSSAQELDAA